MQRPPYAQGSVSQFHEHSCSRAWGELAPHCAPHNPPVHLPPSTLPPSTSHSSSHLPPNRGAFFSLALIMDFLQIIWFILVTGWVGVKLVKVGHFCHFNSYCICCREMIWQENTYVSAQNSYNFFGQLSLFMFCPLCSLSVTCLVYSCSVCFMSCSSSFPHSNIFWPISGNFKIDSRWGDDWRWNEKERRMINM